MKWHVHGVVSASKYLGTVEAETEAEAMKKAEELDSMSVSVCHHCSHQVEDPEITEITVSPDESANHCENCGGLGVIGGITASEPGGVTIDCPECS